MSGEADSGTCPSGDILDPSKVEEPEVDERPACNTNYDSAEGAMPLLRCHRCDAFETVSRAALTSHSAQCTAGSTEGEAEGGSPAQEHSRHHRKMFECDVCNMKFSNGANMRRHKMRHTGVKPYECRVCQKRFFRKDHLAEHFSTHSKTLPFHCPICSRGFQRQIAMRAHFQNEHVGQHDLVKACPLCSYRAPTMKALRVHFFNRHGIDLDNPGPGGSGLLGLPLSTTVTPGIPGGAQSDSGDSTGNRSTDNATPPMHFLTPHVEISMADTEFNTNCDPRPTISSALELPGRLNGEPVSPQSADSNSNAPTSSLSLVAHRGPTPSENITPSISLIPIKQEPPSEDYEKRSSTNAETEGTSSREAAPGGSTATSTSLSSLIKVSPLKSLLREDLKRRISARVQCRTNRIQNQASLTQTHEALPSEVSPVPTTTNGTITSTGQDTEQSSWRRRSNGLMCLFCGIGFPDQTLYFLHKGCHSDSNPWKCNICGEQCNNVYEFNSHLLSKSHQ